MNKPDIQEPDYTYRLAGVTLRTNFLCSLPIGTDEVAPHVTVTCGKGSMNQRFWLPPWKLPSAPSVSVWFSKDGKLVQVDKVYEGDQYDSWLVRNLLPFSLGLQRRLMLHASAVQLNTGAVAFIAESGAGKSTMSTALGAMAHQKLSDDLLACKFCNDTVNVIGDNIDSEVKLDAVCFLSRDPSTNYVSIRPIHGTECLRTLLRNSFSEFPSKSLWRNMLELNSQLVERVQAYNLVVPNDIRQLPQMASHISEYFSMHRQ